MEKLRKSLKAYVIALVLFVALTFALAALVNFTGFRETWTFGALLVIMSISSLVLGMMEGRIFQKRGLLAGGAAAVFFLAIILVSVQGLFAEEFSLGKTGWLYLIPVAAGSAVSIIKHEMRRNPQKLRKLFEKSTCLLLSHFTKSSKISTV